MINVYNGILLSHKNGCNPTFATTWMDLEGTVLSEISQIEKETPDDFSHLWNTKKKKKSEINEQTKKQKQTHGYREQSSVY